MMVEQLHLSESLAGVFSPSLRVWFNQDLSEAHYTVPAELGLMLEFTALLFAALAFSREKELGTLEQLLVMPYSSLEIIIGKSHPGDADRDGRFYPDAGDDPFGLWCACARLIGVIDDPGNRLPDGGVGERDGDLGDFQDPESGILAGDAGGDERFYVHRVCCPGRVDAQGCPVFWEFHPCATLAKYLARDNVEGQRDGCALAKCT